MSDNRNQTCERCGLPASMTIMSKFNTERICGPCKVEEREAPGYRYADDAEVAKVQAGVFNFQGVGLSEKDRRFLALARMERVRDHERNKQIQ